MRCRVFSFCCITTFTRSPLVVFLFYYCFWLALCLLDLKLRLYTTCISVVIDSIAYKYPPLTQDPLRLLRVATFMESEDVCVCY